MNERKKTYTLHHGETVFIEGKHGLVIVNVFPNHTKVHVDEKTDVERARSW